METEKIRMPSVAGQFYESDPVALSMHIQEILTHSPAEFKLKEHQYIQAAILPHAGYTYSGETAVKTLGVAQKCQYERVLVIAPSHRVPFRGIALSDYTSYRTPLGDMEIDLEIQEQILNSRNPYVTVMNEAHAHEHALEVEIPIIQELFNNNLKLVPIICGQFDKKTAEKIGELLLPYWEPDTLWILSSDFTHYGHSFSYVPFNTDVKDNLKNLDLGAVNKILALDLDGFEKYLSETGATICGSRPIQILLATANLAKNCGKNSVKPNLIEYKTSGDISGDYSHCVSYAGLIFISEN